LIAPKAPKQMSNYRDELEALSHENEALRRKVADLEAERAGAKPPAPPRRARVGLVIGVATAVLCMGVVAALFVSQPPPPPAAEARALPAPTTDSPINITIAVDGRVTVDGERLSDVALSDRLAMYARLRHGQRAVITADSSVAHSRVVEVMDRARAAGVTRISFSVAAR
jgi:biopolymer transport protein ExbD